MSALFIMFQRQGRQPMVRPEKQEIEELEHRFWRMIVDKDVEGSVLMLTSESIVTGARGTVMLTHSEYRAMARQGEGMWQLKSFRLDDVKVTFPSDDVAVIAYEVTGEMEVDGEALTLKAADATTWIRKEGEWLAALHTESVLGDPFGRDRLA
ncbi:nuclear transport factor 2 family protein [Aminobacter sp. MET-1]|uniref:nuclear transport factor 2 family protein n=1 Tax=Aminobacter sp. MET-1 TaxID=2951085 RepID=UPI00226A071B|nr:nuclear transport factor 2 family protein [Aminobacter sp. MET-1]MCX8570772.1 nuclear transport factor 2 family protein [Aminobacter sp. MET-1]